MSNKTYNFSFTLTSTEKTEDDVKTVTICSEKNANVYAAINRLLCRLHVIEGDKDKVDLKEFYNMLERVILLGNGNAANSGNLPLARLLNFVSREVEIARQNL